MGDWMYSNHGDLIDFSHPKYLPSVVYNAM